jgi:hypothetical protein
MKDMFDNFCWHSSIGIDDVVDNNRNFVTRIANTKRARSQFITAGENLLIHKLTEALWKISDDKKTIEPVFGSDILTEDDLKASEGE